LIQTTISYTSDISYLVISDIHLGKKDRTEDIIHSLDIFFSNYTLESRFTKLDIIFLAGDVFDDMVETMNSDMYHILSWVGRLMRFCQRYDIRLRVLEGTPSHDYKQSKLFEPLALATNSSDKALNFKYIEALSIERFDDLDGLTCLYVPDEWTSEPSDTYDQSIQLLKEQGLRSVDIGIMHGMFTYQKPTAAVNIPCHIEDQYLSIVERWINIGHVHSYSSFNRILAQGSFDRLAHGEEHPKGAILCRLSPKGDQFTFLENKEAKIYKTIELKNKDLDKSLLQIENILAKIPQDSYIRIKAKKDHPVYIAFEEVKTKFPMYKLVKLSLESEEEQQKIQQEQLDQTGDYTPITINRDNVVDLLMSEVRKKHQLDEGRLAALSDILRNSL
jgi:hypothetical protein